MVLRHSQSWLETQGTQEHFLFLVHGSIFCSWLFQGKNGLLARPASVNIKISVHIQMKCS